MSGFGQQYRPAIASEDDITGGSISMLYLFLSIGSSVVTWHFTDDKPLKIPSKICVAVGTPPFYLRCTAAADIQKMRTTRGKRKSDVPAADETEVEASNSI